MKFQVINRNTLNVECEFFMREDAIDAIEYDYSWDTHTINAVVPCRGCGSHESDERHDWYGITTGHWCDDCYESNRYPYKKSRYATEEYDGYGERLGEDY